MAYDFNADDILAMAEEMERNGARFYRRTAGETDDPSAKQLLTEFAAMEDDHEKTFAQMRAALSDPEKASTVFDPEGEAAAYLKALVDTKVFFEKEVDTSSLEKILKSAIEAEKDAIVFYLGMRECVSEALGKDRVDAIIKEEMMHVRLLSKQLTAQKK